MTNRMISVVAQRIASAERQVLAQRRLLVEEPRRLPADLSRERRRHRAHLAHEVLGLLAQRRPGGDQVDPRPSGPAAARPGAGSRAAYAPHAARRGAGATAT